MRRKSNRMLTVGKHAHGCESLARRGHVHVSLSACLTDWSTACSATSPQELTNVVCLLPLRHFRASHRGRENGSEKKPTTSQPWPIRFPLAHDCIHSAEMACVKLLNPEKSENVHCSKLHVRYPSRRVIHGCAGIACLDACVGIAIRRATPLVRQRNACPKIDLNRKSTRHLAHCGCECRATPGRVHQAV